MSLIQLPDFKYLRPLLVRNFIYLKFKNSFQEYFTGRKENLG